MVGLMIDEGQTNEKGSNRESEKERCVYIIIVMFCLCCCQFVSPCSVLCLMYKTILLLSGRASAHGALDYRVNSSSSQCFMTGLTNGMVCYYPVYWDGACKPPFAPNQKE